MGFAILALFAHIKQGDFGAVMQPVFERIGIDKFMHDIAWK